MAAKVVGLQTVLQFIPLLILNGMEKFYLEHRFARGKEFMLVT